MKTNGHTKPSVSSEPIAIVGMRGRFPGANDLDTYWRNLAEGVESISVLSKEEMRAAGVPDHVSRLPGYVNASPVLGAIDEFDAEFFGFSARDAALTDPQHRLFLETCWEALEDAGYDPARYDGSVGLFGGCELSSYLYQLYRNIDSLPYLDGMQLMVTNDKDHLCTQVSYRLDLRGPSIAVQTTCSTSLVAVSLACESLQVGRCSMALAGGVTVRVPQKGGYFYAAGSILSPDGHCRPFDADAQGTVVGSGVGVVVLRRLSDALASGDNIRAVILGAGLNNDGSDKVGYAAPSFRGQTAAIRAAHAAAGINADSIGYVEAHGTGTILGDPIEFSALNEAFRGSGRKGYCGIGSVKSNVGHLSCAAGIAGLIKTVLVLENGAIPPTVHYRAPNPAIDFASSPFFLTNKLHPWPRNGVPRRAGVSSFGVGGTNAHVVVEEAPTTAQPKERRAQQLLTLSARSPGALDQATARLAAHLTTHSELDLADIAYTLHQGRRAFQHRRVVLVEQNDRERAVAQLSESGRLPTTLTTPDRPIVFMFPGQGAQYPGMAAGLYETEPVVKKIIDQCARILAPELGADLRKLLFPAPRRRSFAATELRDTRWAQPALFTVGYAVAQLWRSWGVQPTSMIGHSVGEYVAAVLAGVMSLEDALRLIARRGRLISSLPRGSMLAVFAPAEQLERFIGGQVSLAAVNGPSFAVLSGPDSAIDGVESALGGEAIVARRLHTSHAFHSAMMDPILGEFEQLVSGVDLSAPAIPFATTLTGSWANGDVTRAAYWSSQIRDTVRFADAVRTTRNGAAANENALFLEVGPGSTLATFVLDTARGAGALACLTSLPSAQDDRSDTQVMLASLGQLWAGGAAVDWSGFHANERRRRVSLPTYPFERRSYWIGERQDGTQPDEADRVTRPARDTSSWFYRPCFVEQPLEQTPKDALKGRRVLVLDEGRGLGAALVQRLKKCGALPITLFQLGAKTPVDPDQLRIDPSDAGAWQTFATELCRVEPALSGVIDCWSADEPGNTDLDRAALVGLLAPMRLACALSALATARPLPLLLVARGTRRIDETDALDPPRALGAGMAKVLPQEHPSLRLAHIDVDGAANVADRLLDELAAGLPEPVVALRKGKRFVETYEPELIQAGPAPLDLPERPVVLVTGGLGHMGLHLAEGVFQRWQARLVLLGRADVPPATKWAAASQDAALPADRRRLLSRLARLQAERDDVLVLQCDMNDPDQVKRAVDVALERFGSIDLAIHGAARIDAGAFGAAADTGPDVVEAQFSPKLRGLQHLVTAMRGREPARWVLHSSISSVLGGLGLAAYSGANAVLDAYALAGGDSWLSIGWDLWDNAAEAKMAGMPVAIEPEEGSDAFERLLGGFRGSRVIVAVGDLGARLQSWVRRAASSKQNALVRHPRPNLSTALVEPRTPTERALAEIWSEQLALSSIGIHDRFFDLGGHSLLAVQVATEIRERLQVEIPVLKLFQAPTIAGLAAIIDAADRTAAMAPTRAVERLPSIAPPIVGDSPAAGTKTHYREFYDDVTRRLEQAGVGEASFFLNYGYISLGSDDQARFEVPAGVFNPSSVRLAFELIGPTDLRGKRVLDVGCGRGGAVALMAEQLEANATGVDLSPQAVAFCRRTHQHPRVRYEVGDAENLPCETGAFEVVTNMESSHTYPSLRAFFAEVARVLETGGTFLYTDLLPALRWTEVRALLEPLGLKITYEREITPNVLASCDQVAATRAEAFGGGDVALNNFLAVPGSMVYEQMASRAWEYRIVRATRK